MNGLRTDAVTLASAIAAQSVPEGVEVALFPPFTMLDTVALRLQSAGIGLGAQDCSAEAEGAFTGDISAGMLKDAGCKYVIVGHSERRMLHGETDELVKRKAQAAMKAGLVPVICVGESLAEREAGRHLQCVVAQVEKSLQTLVHSDAYLIAYEPVWAIGSGKTPTSAEITEMHKTIASRLTYATSGARTAILYGGSVKAATAQGILASDGVDGVLVGGASLNAQEFGAIIASV